MRYTDDHEWIEADGDAFTIGITDHAQEALGDIVFVELPDVGASFSKGDVMATVESVKAASDIYAPFDGKITASNEVLGDEPGTVNSAPTSGGWFVKMTATDASQLDDLLDQAAYDALIA
jgi:glycine cleavage system H protein